MIAQALRRIAGLKTSRTVARSLPDRRIERRRQGRARRVLRTHLPWMEASLEGPIPGCVRLQICGLLAWFCRDLQNYLVDIVDVEMSPVQFGTPSRHPVELRALRS